MNWESWRWEELRRMYIGERYKIWCFEQIRSFSYRFINHCEKHLIILIRYIDWINLPRFKKINEKDVNMHWAKYRIHEHKDLIEAMSGDYFIILSRYKIFSYRFMIYLKQKRDKESYYGKR